MGTTVKIKVRRQGGSLAITLPNAMSEALHLREGDEVHVTQTADGLVVRAHDPAFEAVAEAAEWVARRYRNTFKALADA